MLFMKKLMRNKTAFFIAIALIVNNRAFAMNKNKAQSFQVSAVKKATKNPNKGFVNWVKNHKLISAVSLSGAVAAVAAAVGLTAWGINRNKTKNIGTKELEKKELDKLALEQETMERASIFALCCMDKKTREILNTLEQVVLCNCKNTVKKRIIDDIKKRRFKITEIIDSTLEKTLKYSNSDLTETEKFKNYELKPLTEEVCKKYYDILNSSANILESKNKISKNREIAKDEVYINIHKFKVVDKKSTTVIEDLTNILGLALTKKLEIGRDIVIEPGDDFYLEFNQQPREYIILQQPRNIKFSIHDEINLITIKCQLVEKI